MNKIILNKTKNLDLRLEHRRVVCLCALMTQSTFFIWKSSVGQAACVFFEKKALESHVLWSDKKKIWCRKDQKRRKKCFRIIFEHLVNKNKIERPSVATFLRRQNLLCRSVMCWPRSQSIIFCGFMGSKSRNDLKISTQFYQQL